MTRGKQQEKEKIEAIEKVFLNPLLEKVRSENLELRKTFSEFLRAKRSKKSKRYTVSVRKWACNHGRRIFWKINNIRNWKFEIKKIPRP